MAELVQFGDFITKGEQTAAEYFRDKLPREWKVVSNKIFTMPNGSTREVDFIIVADHTIFVADEKGLRGRIHGTESYWVLDSRESLESPLNKMEYVARRLAGYVRDQVPGVTTEFGGVPFVLPLVILSDPEATLLVQEQRRDQIVKLADADQALRTLDRRNRDHDLARFQPQIMEKLRLLPPRPTLPRAINAYRILEALTGGPHYRAFLAQHEAATTDGKRRLKLYELSGLNNDERSRQEELIYRDFHALSKLVNAGMAPGVDLPFKWGDDRYIVVPQHLVALPSLRAYSVSLTSGELTLGDALELGEALLTGLALLHEQGVVHRNLTPDNVFLDQSRTPPRVVFADFEFARLANSQSIASTADALALDSPYRAPELAVSMSFASAASDIFAAGLILAELFTGMSAQEMRDTDGNINIPALRLDDSGLLPDEIDNLRDVLRSMVVADDRNRWQSAEEARKFLRELFAARLARADAAASEASSEVRQPVVEGTPGQRPFGGLYQRGDRIAEQYEVERVLGTGGTANTYLVRDYLYGGTFVLKQIRDPLQAHRLAGNEFNALQRLPSHRCIMRVFDVRRPEDPFHLKLEYVHGSSVDDLSSEFPWPLDRVLSFAHDVLEALDTLEAHAFAHRDLSARNIIITDSGPKLIDFGFAAPIAEVGRTAVGTVAYRAPELDRGDPWNSTCDTYALGVLLFRMLTGKSPFCHDLQGRFDKSQIISLAPADDLVRGEVLGVIRRAISADQSSRFTTAKEFADALRTAAAAQGFVTATGERVINTWVTDIQGLYRNSRVGNADNRGLDTDFACDTYVPTKLDRELIPRVLEGRYWVVLLSGNPGDGKTAFLEQLGEALAEAGAEAIPCDSQNGWRYRLEEREFAANYDASESSRGKRANELLDEILRPFRGDSAPRDPAYTALLAINDGKLREFLLSNPNYKWLGKQVYRLLERPDWHVDERVALVDLKQRAVVGGELAEGAAGDLFDQVLGKLIFSDEWRACDACRARTTCPMKFNRDTLADPQHGAEVRRRIRALLQIIHLRRERHVTMRDLRSALAYLLTGATTCGDIHRELDQNERPPHWYNRLYFMAAFNPEDEGEDNLKDFAACDPAEVSSPRLDRFLHFRRHADTQHEIDGIMLPLTNRALDPLNGLNITALGRDWYGAYKRRLFFEGDGNALLNHEQHLPEWPDLLPYRHFSAFLDAVSGRTPLEAVRDTLCEAISRADGIVDPRMYRQFLCVRTSHNEEVGLTVFKRFPHSEFECRVLLPRETSIEVLPNALELLHLKSDASILISLDLYEILMRFSEGYQAGAEEQQPFVIDLAQFQNRLLNQAAEELLLMESGRQLHRVRQVGGFIELLPVEQG